MGTFIFRLNRNAASSTVLDSELEEEEEAYKCEFCDIIFLRVESIVKHRRYFCPKRRRLPRSCTATTATSSNGQQATDEESGSQFHEAKAKPSLCSQPGILPQAEDTACLLGDRTFSENPEDSGREQPPAKRKRSPDEQDPAMDSFSSSQEKSKRLLDESVVVSSAIKTKPVNTGL